MSNEDFDLLEKYVDGLLGLTQKNDLELRLKEDVVLREQLQLMQKAKKVVLAEEELELLEFMQNTDAKRGEPKEPQVNSIKSHPKKTLNRWWFWAILVAALLIIGITIFEQTTDIDKSYIADSFALEEIGHAVRGENKANEDSLIEVTYIIPMQQISKLIKAGNLEAARNNLANLRNDFPIAQQNIEYTTALIAYLENGRKDKTFQTILNKILDDPTHNCYPLAVRLNNEVNSIWGRLKD